MPSPYYMTYSGPFDVACLGLYGRFMSALNGALGRGVTYSPLDDTLGVMSCTARHGGDLYTLTIARSGQVSITVGKRKERSSKPLYVQCLLENQEIVEEQ